MKKNPCHGCENRIAPTKTEAGCHEFCELYKEYSDQCKELLRKKRKYYDAENTYISHVIGTINRNNNRRKEAGKEIG